jgi:hypothetical protein
MHLKSDKLLNKNSWYRSRSVLLNQGNKWKCNYCKWEGIETEFFELVREVGFSIMEIGAQGWNTSILYLWYLCGSNTYVLCMYVCTLTFSKGESLVNVNLEPGPSINHTHILLLDHDHSIKPTRAHPLQLSAKFLISS